MWLTRLDAFIDKHAGDGCSPFGMILVATFGFGVVVLILGGAIWSLAKA